MENCIVTDKPWPLCSLRRWSQVIVDAYYPKLYLVRYKNTGGKRGKGKDFVDAKELVQTAAPMVPGVLFIKCKMNPEIAVRYAHSSWC